MTKFTTKTGPAKAPAAKKPHPDFPLTRHPRGYWCKKVRGKMSYFGKIADDPEGEKALNLWLEQKDDLLAGRTPRVQPGDGLTVADLVNHYLNAKKARIESGELLQQTWDEYFKTCTLITDVFGSGRLAEDLAADDFQQLRATMAKNWGPVRLANEIQRTRSVFKYGFDNSLLDKPVRFGSEFVKPSQKVLRKQRNKKGPRMFEADELRKLLDEKRPEGASPQLRAMIYLGINAAFGCTDCATIPAKAVNLKTGWLTFPRTKTGIQRRIPLWAETVTAIRAATKASPAPVDDDHRGLLFISARGKSFAQAKQTHWLVSGETAALLRRLKMDRPGLGFYALRHTFQTVAEGARDLAAVQSIMGHAAAANDMSAVYRERVDDERLLAVTQHVRKWLLPVAATTKTK